MSYPFFCQMPDIKRSGIRKRRWPTSSHLMTRKMSRTLGRFQKDSWGRGELGGKLWPLLGQYHVSLWKPLWAKFQQKSEQQLMENWFSVSECGVWVPEARCEKHRWRGHGWKRGRCVWATQSPLRSTLHWHFSRGGGTFINALFSLSALLGEIRPQVFLCLGHHSFFRSPFRRKECALALLLRSGEG